MFVLIVAAVAKGRKSVYRKRGREKRVSCIKPARKQMIIMLKKTSQFITVCKGDMNHRKPKTAKIILWLNFGLYHHVLNSCCPYKASRSE